MSCDNHSDGVCTRQRPIHVPIDVLPAAVTTVDHHFLALSSAFLASLTSLSSLLLPLPLLCPAHGCRPPRLRADEPRRQMGQTPTNPHPKKTRQSTTPTPLYIHTHNTSQHSSLPPQHSSLHPNTPNLVIRSSKHTPQPHMEHATHAGNRQGQRRRVREPRR